MYGFGFGFRRCRQKFTPASLFPAAGAYYDPSDFSTMFQDQAGTTPVTATGQPVGKINDKSGNSHHLLMTATAGTAPLLQQASGRYYLQFDGVDDYLQSLAWTSIPQPLDRVCAVQLDTWVINRYIFDGGVADQLILRQNGVTPELAIYAGIAAANNNADTLGAPVVVTERYDTTDSLTVQATTTTGDAGAQALTGLTVGGRNGNAANCPVKVFGIIVRSQMTAAQLANAQAWLRGKSGAA
jgi:hypothetical protein